MGGFTLDGGGGSKWVGLLTTAAGFTHAGFTHACCMTHAGFTLDRCMTHAMDPEMVVQSLSRIISAAATAATAAAPQCL